MTTGWTRSTIGETFTTVTGNTPPKADGALFGNFLPLVKPPELLDAPLAAAEDGLSEAGARIARLAPPGTVLISCIGNLGKVGLNTVPVAFNQQINAVIPNRDKAVPEFIFYQALSPDFKNHLEALATGTTVRIVSKAKFNTIPMVLPDLAEQRRIVAILDEAFEAIATAKANAEKNLLNAHGWAAAQGSAALRTASAGAPQATLEALVAPTCTLSYGIVQPGEEVLGGLPVVRPVDLVEKTIRVDGLKRIDPALARSYARTTLEGGDLLLCVRGTTGTVAMADPALAGANVTRGIVPIRFAPRTASQAFGYHLLRSEPVQAQIRAKTYGAALMQINIGDLRKIVVAVPPLDQQPALVAKLDAIEDAGQQLARIYSRKLAALDELKQSLLHQAFTGTLTARPADQQLAATA